MDKQDAGSAGMQPERQPPASTPAKRKTRLDGITQMGGTVSFDSVGGVSIRVDIDPSGAAATGFTSYGAQGDSIPSNDLPRTATRTGDTVTSSGLPAAALRTDYTVRVNYQSDGACSKQGTVAGSAITSFPGTAPVTLT